MADNGLTSLLKRSLEDYLQRRGSASLCSSDGVWRETGLLKRRERSLLKARAREQAWQEGSGAWSDLHIQCFSPFS